VGSDRLRRSEPPLRGIARISRALVHELDANAPIQSLEDRVHDARVAAKKLRAYALLLRPATGGATFRELNDPLRAAGRALSAHRDRDIAVTTLPLLEESVDEHLRPLFSEAARALTEISDAPKQLRERQRALAELSRALESTSGELAALKLRRRGWHVLGPGYARTYRQCMQRLERFRASGLPDDAHALRKRVKPLGFQMALLEAANPDSIARLRAELKDLGHQLGLLHDCTIVVQLASSKALKRRLPAADLERVRTAAHEREAGLARVCLPLAQRLFASPPDGFMGSLERDWRQWRRPRPGGRKPGAIGR